MNEGVTASGPTAHIVLRPADGLPASILGGSLAGTWLDVRGTPPASFDLGGLHAVATDRFELRDDGETARVYEVRPAQEAPAPEDRSPGSQRPPAGPRDA